MRAVGIVATARRSGRGAGGSRGVGFGPAPNHALLPPTESLAVIMQMSQLEVNAVLGVGGRFVAMTDTKAKPSAIQTGILTAV